MDNEIQPSPTLDDALKRVGAVLRARRKELGRTIAQTAEAAGMAPSYLSMVETGRVDRPPSVRLLRGLARALGLDTDELLAAAAWEQTPAAVRDQVDRLRGRAAAGADLARWLTEAAASGGVDLDALHASGDLRRRIEAALGEDDPSPLGRTQPVARSVPLINKVAAGYPTGFTDLDYPAQVADEYVPAHHVNDPDAFAATVTGQSMEPAYHEGDVVVFSPLADVADGNDCFIRLEPNHETRFKRVYFEPSDEGPERIRLQPLNPKFPPRVVDREQVAGLYRAVWKMSAI